MRIHGLDFNSDEDNSVTEKVDVTVGIEFNQNEIDRDHYVGKSCIDKKKEKKVRLIIVKFSSWELRTAFYKS